MELTAAELATLVGGVAAGAPGARVTSYAIDSRTLHPGACFVALRGRRDGHDFVADAFARGARVALVARAVEHPPATALVVVDDPLRALARLAEHARGRMAETTVVGVTGSAGKTATKDLTAAALGGARRVHASPGSFNNESGLPLTLLGAPPETEVIVAEMGARFPGNVAELCALARPEVGIVTHVGLAHAEHLGGREGAAKAKGELVEALPRHGFVVLNADDDTTPALAQRAAATVLRVGRAPDADVLVRDVTVDAELHPRFRVATPWGRAVVALRVRGEHQAQNAAMALAVAGALGVPLEAAVAGLESATTAAWRMELHVSPAGVTVLNDAYNASPSSMAAAVRSLAQLPVRGRRIAILGDMLELGEHAEREHEAVGALVAGAGIDVLVVVGAASAAAGARARATGLEVLQAADRDEVLGLLAGRLHPGDAVLVKASRAVGLETVADALARGALDG